MSTQSKEIGEQEPLKKGSKCNKLLSKTKCVITSKVYQTNMRITHTLIQLN